MIAAFVVGLVAGAVLGWLARTEVVKHLIEQRNFHRHEAAVATDRLVNGWKDGAIVTPRPDITPPPPLEALPTELQAEVEQWEDPAHRASLETHIRQLMAQGRGPQAILRELDNTHP